MNSISGAAFAPRYADSWAVVVGICNYEFAGNLEHAVNDANAVADALQSLGFEQARISVLVDEGATAGAIRESLFRIVRDSGSDDRVVFFFAGHGHTTPTTIGSMGFLVPYEGNPASPASLLQWDELVRIGEAIPAKHVLFVVDACYSGLALTRSSGGTTRYLQDVLSRFSRQVLTAGTSDQTVADGGGPRAGHSVFTGHFLDALAGEARDVNGVISARSVMQYVYENVSSDAASQQTPQSGSLRGEGDLILSMPEQSDDLPVVVPIQAWEPPVSRSREEFLHELKAVVSQEYSELALQELLHTEVQDYLAWAQSSGPMQAPAAFDEDFVRSLMSEYEERAKRLVCAAAIIARWGVQDAMKVLELAISRLAESLRFEGPPNRILLGLQWYPVVSIINAGVIGSVVREDFVRARRLALRPEVATTQLRGEGRNEVLFLAAKGVLDAVSRGRVLEHLEEHRGNYVPASERQLRYLQPLLSPLLWSGSSFESLFDKAELFVSLLYFREIQSGWAPAGRYVWKFLRGGGPLASLIQSRQEGAPEFGLVQHELLELDSNEVEQFLDAFCSFCERLQHY